MNKALARALVVVTIAAASAGCDGRMKTPISPTHGPPPPAVSTGSAYQVADVTLSGYVFEMTPSGRQPIEGVHVQNGEGDGDTTDAEGFYSFGPIWVCPCPAQPWVPANTTFLWVEKAGYTNPPGLPASIFGSAVASTGARDVIIDGDTRFDIELILK